MTMNWAEIVFWSAVALVGYAYVGFPVLILLRGLLWRRPYATLENTPTVSLIIVAHNEAASIGSKLENALALDYPADRLEVLVASDGSTDGTDEIARGYAARGVRLMSLPRQGKIPALNTVVAAATGEVLVFSDANSIYAPDALRALMRPLADPAVGGVAGDQRYAKDGTAAAGERAYWSLDRWLKKLESAAGNTISATGAIYAIRRSLFRECPSGVTDDFATSTGVIAQGYRLVFAGDAAAYEPVAKANGVEFGRKVRVMTRGLRGVLMRSALLNPLRYGFYSLQLFSHKVLRRLVVVPLLVLLAVTPLLWNEGPVYRAALVGQLAVYSLGLLGLLLGNTRLGRIKLFSIPFYFCLVNTACLVAAIRVLRGQRIELWEPQRASEPSVASERLRGVA
jgi:cellulose synthase/poly-beta-1,6-N-acetylglucosamine synthase-like glycosyltransferase